MTENKKMPTLKSLREEKGYSVAVLIERILEVVEFPQLNERGQPFTQTNLTSMTYHRWEWGMNEPRVCFKKALSIVYHLSMEEIEQVLAETLKQGHHARPEFNPGKINTDDLSDQELRIFIMLGQNYSRKQISASLNIERGKVDEMVKTILDKLHLPTVTALMRLYRQALTVKPEAEATA